MSKRRPINSDVDLQDEFAGKAYEVAFTEWVKKKGMKEVIPWEILDEDYKEAMLDCCMEFLNRVREHEGW